MDQMFILWLLYPLPAAVNLVSTCHHPSIVVGSSTKKFIIHVTELTGAGTLTMHRDAGGRISPIVTKLATPFRD